MRRVEFDFIIPGSMDQITVIIKKLLHSTVVYLKVLTIELIEMQKLHYF